MKKLAAVLLTVLTIVTTALCGCAESKVSNDFDDSAKDSRNIQIEETDEKGEKSPNGKCPEPRKSQKRRGKRLPRPKPAYRK